MFFELLSMISIISLVPLGLCTSKKAYTIEKNPLEYDIKPVRQSIQGTKRSNMSKLDETCIQYWVYFPNIRNFGI
jgi:hypothetical protein